MTDKKITNLTNIVAADLVDADEFVVVDISADETMALTLGELKTAVGGGAGDLLAANNLSDLANAGTARTNLGLGTAATTASTDYATAAQGTLADSAVQPNDSPTFAGLTTTADVSFGDNDKLKFGDGSDLEIFHSGTGSFIRDIGGGDLQIVASDDVFIRGYATNNYMARFAETGAVTLYHNNSEKLATSSTGVEVTGNATFADNGKATFGDGADLQIFHTGSSSWIRDLGTGGLTIDTNGTVIDLKGSSPTEYMARFIKDGAVSLYHNGSPKLATTATGVDVTGTVTATTVDLGNWTVTESSGVLYFATGGVNKMKLESSGDLTVVGNITAYGTI
jgi:hypothetical protein